MNERELFEIALEKATAEERSDFLRDACGDDSELRERVEGLLRTHERTGDFLQMPLADRLAEGVAALEDADGATSDSADCRKGADDLRFLSPSDEPGSLGRLGHYEVREVIGRGGMGIVLRAFDERLHRVVAIKTFAPSLAANATSRKRFLREARAAAAVCHDHIVTIHAVEESGDLPYLVMQCISGPSLQQRIDRDGPLALHEILRIGMQTAAGMAAAHAQGLIHRDIKPANILLENGVERVKITDFGLARATADASVTQTGMVAGTPHYMAPEQARGEALDCRTDLFSLGSVLYAMCTGRAPFRAGNSMAVLKHVCDDVPRPIREANADIPDWLIAVVEKLHAKNPNDRYQSAAEVAELLGQRLARLQHPSMPAPTARLPVAAEAGRKPVRRRLAWAAGVAAAAALLLLGVSFTEASGVTQFVPTVIRIVRGEGTLVVEVADPTVQVSLDGEELSIRGAGLQELRLLPGEYRVHATKDGKPVKDEVVTIARGGKEIVSVRLESPRPSLARNEIRRFAPYWGAVTSVAVSPDGHHALFGGEDMVVWLADLVGKEKPRSFKGHTQGVQSVAFSPDGRHVLSGAQDGAVWLWDVESGRVLRQFAGHTEVVWKVAFSPDGKLAASGGGGLFKDNSFLAPKDTTVRLWDVQTGTELRRLTGHNDHVRSISFSPDGMHLLTGCGNGDPIIRSWDVASGNELGRWEGHSLAVYSLVHSADGRTALSASADRTIRLWDVATGKTIGPFLGHTNDVTSVAFSPDERLCVSSSWDKTVRLWDVGSRKELARFEGHTSSVRDVAFLPDGRGVFSGAEDGTARLWRTPESAWRKQEVAPSSVKRDAASSRVVPAAEGSTAELTLLTKLEGHTDLVRAVAFSPDGRRVLSVGRDKLVRFWDLETREALSTLQVDGHIRAADVSADGRLVALATATDGPDPGMFQIWDLEKRKRICKAPPRNVLYLNYVRFSPDGTRVVTGGSPSDGVLWDARTGEELQRFELDDPSVSHTAEFSSDGRLLAVGAVGRVRLFDVESGDVVGDVVLPHVRAALCLTFSAGGDSLACGQMGGLTTLIDVDQLEVKDSFADPDPNAHVNCARFLDGDRFLCTTLGKGIFRIWDAEEARLVTTARTEDGTNKLLAVSPDGRYAVTACGEIRDASGALRPNGDYALRIWQLPESVWPKESPPASTTQGGAASFSVPPAAELAVDELTLLAKLDEHADVVRGVAFSPDGRRMVSAGGDQAVYVWDMRTRSTLSLVAFATGDATVSSDGRLVAGRNSTERVIQVWDVEQQKVVCRFATELVAGANDLCFTPDGTVLLTSGQRSRHGVLWDVATGTELWRFDIGEDGGIHRAAFPPDGRLLAIGGSGRVRLFDVERKTAVADIPLLHPWNVWDLEFAPSGKTLATGQGGGHVSLIDVDSRQVIKRLQASDAQVRALRFLGDERFLLTSSHDATLRLWDLERKTVVAQAPTENGSQLIFVSPDGRHAVTAGGKEWDDASRSLKDYGDYAMLLWQLPKSVWPAEPLNPGDASPAGPD